jgi:hypothetical protein
MVATVPSPPFAALAHAIAFLRRHFASVTQHVSFGLFGKNFGTASDNRRVTGTIQAAALAAGRSSLAAGDFHSTANRVHHVTLAAAAVFSTLAAESFDSAANGVNRATTLAAAALSTLAGGAVHSTANRVNQATLAAAALSTLAAGSFDSAANGLNRATLAAAALSTLAAGSFDSAANGLNRATLAAAALSSLATKRRSGGRWVRFGATASEIKGAFGWGITWCCTCLNRGNVGVRARCYRKWFNRRRR